MAPRPRPAPTPGRRSRCPRPAPGAYRSAAVAWTAAFRPATCSSTAPCCARCRSTSRPPRPGSTWSTRPDHGAEETSRDLPSPGVYIEEVPSGPQPIAAAPTSVVADPRHHPQGPGPRADPGHRLGGLRPHRSARPPPEATPASRSSASSRTAGPRHGWSGSTRRRPRRGRRRRGRRRELHGHRVVAGHLGQRAHHLRRTRRRRRHRHVLPGDDLRADRGRDRRRHHTAAGRLDRRTQPR